MLVYEKDNKLNINFDNEVSEYPDLQISKSGDETEVLIDGWPIGGGSGDDSSPEIPVPTSDDERHFLVVGPGSNYILPNMSYDISAQPSGSNIRLVSVFCHYYFESNYQNLLSAIQNNTPISTPDTWPKRKISGIPVFKLKGLSGAGEKTALLVGSLSITTNGLVEFYPISGVTIENNDPLNATASWLTI